MVTKAGGGGARRGDHRLGVPTPEGWEERLCGGRSWRESGATAAGLVPHPLGLSLRPRELGATQQAGLELSCTALSPEAVNLVSIICNHLLVHNTRLLPRLGSTFGVPSSQLSSSSPGRF